MAKFVQKPPKREKPRRPRVSHIGDLVGAAMGDLLRKRGFASSDLVANWREIVPGPYDKNVVPDRLKWARNGSEGGTLHVRVSPAHALALQHDAPLLIERINGYFGFELVSAIRLMQMPLERRATGSDKLSEPVTPQQIAEQREKVARSVDGLEDGALKDSLRALGTSIFASAKK